MKRPLDMCRSRRTSWRWCRRNSFAPIVACVIAIGRLFDLRPPQLFAVLPLTPASPSTPRRLARAAAVPERHGVATRVRVPIQQPGNVRADERRVAIAVGVAAGAAAMDAGGQKLKGRFTLVAYILLWYAISLAYNIYFKRALNAFPFPWACALWQISSGCFVFGPLWALGIRKAPKLTFKECIRILPAAVGNLTLHVGAVIAFFGGAVSFVHVVKASEPVVSCFLSLLFLGELFAWPVYASLVPIIGGVALASAKELSFTWLAFGGAMASNFGSAGRSVYAKMVLGGGGIGENMTSANTFSVLTLIGMVLLAPIAFVAESPGAMLDGFRSAVAKGGAGFLFDMVASGLTYYLYNELAFLALGRLDAVSHAVANTIKRVVIIAAAVIVFRTKITFLGAVGSTMAIAGTLFYSLAKTK